MAEQAVPIPLIVGLGEAMLRLSTRGATPLASAREFGVHVAGAELNLLIAATALGARGRWATRLPANELGTMMRRHALSYGIEVAAIDEAEGRAGLFFFEPGTPPRPSTVLYDRAGSAPSHLSPTDFAWDQVLAGASGAHVTGITCALGTGPLEAAIAFLGAARSLGVLTSFDMNYRAQLWNLTAAHEAYRRVMPLVDTLFVAPNDLTMLMGSHDAEELLGTRLCEEYGVQTLVIREREEISLDELGVRVRVLGAFDAPATASGHVVDELGAGDAAAGAFLSSMLLGDPSALSAERCARAYARMLTIPGDSWSGSIRDLTEGYVTHRKVVR